MAKFLESMQTKIDKSKFDRRPTQSKNNRGNANIPKKRMEKLEQI